MHTIIPSYALMADMEKIVVLTYHFHRASWSIERKYCTMLYAIVDVAALWTAADR